MLGVLSAIPLAYLGRVEGSWVHLLCALFTPKVVFVDWDLLTAVSTFEMPYREFGRNACAACASPILARTVPVPSSRHVAQD